MRPTIMLADDHAIVLEGLRHTLDRAEFQVVGVARDGWTLVRDAARLHPDTIVTDIAMPGLTGIEAARRIHEDDPKAKIIFLTMHSELVYASAALAAGASGYVLKSAAGEELVAAVRAALDGGSYISEPIAQAMARARQAEPAKDYAAAPLTLRQNEVLQLLAKGMQAKEIAATLNVSARTIEFHKYRIMNALGLRTISELTRYAVRNGLVK